MNPVQVLKKFLNTHHLEAKPLLLALSGGADSLCLFYALLECRQPFHVAHIDHGWRPESQQERVELEQLAAKHQIPFYSIRLDLSSRKGNLEDISRQERMRFFAELCSRFGFEGVLLGHHGNDQAETVLKRVLEGAHWSNWRSLQPDTVLDGIRLLRPFLPLSKADILQWLQKKEYHPFEDSTNKDLRFLRARMRESLLPRLSQEFGKDVQHPLQVLGEESQELKDYFDQKIDSFLQQIVRGPLGLYLDEHPSSLLECKYLVRKVCEQEGLSLSRDSVNILAEGLLTRAANRFVQAGKQKIWVDRGLFFIPTFSEPLPFKRIFLSKGCTIIPNWIIEVKEGENLTTASTSWKEGWQGTFRAVLPKEQYTLALPVSNASYQTRKSSISKWWNHHKIPVFLSSVVPVIWLKDSIYHEFLTGRSSASKNDEQDKIEVILKYQIEKERT